MPRHCHLSPKCSLQLQLPTYGLVATPHEFGALHVLECRGSSRATVPTQMVGPLQRPIYVADASKNDIIDRGWLARGRTFTA